MSIRDIYSEKQIEVLKKVRQEDWFIMGLHGAKRSGKTIINNDIFLQELIRIKRIAKKQGIEKPQYILAGVSSKTIQNNILNEIKNKYELEIKHDKHNNIELFGVKIILAYTGTIAGVGNIRGMTAFGAYINEASLANEQVFKEIISRCSGTGARIVWDSNPDVPNHWLKKDYIDNKTDSIINYHFKLDDNTFLDERYKRNIKESTPKGVYWDRDILGLWTVGEGQIFKDFDKDKHYIEKYPDNLITYYAGVDWGYEHYGAIVIIGEDETGTKYLIDGVAKRHKEIDYWVDRIKEYANKYNPKMPVYCDSARPEHIDRFYREKINVYKANKSILAGIEHVAKAFKTNKLYILKDKIHLFDKEIYSYTWDSKTGMPIKQNDDVMDAMRYAIYSRYDYENSNFIKTIKGGL